MKNLQTNIKRIFLSPIKNQEIFKKADKILKNLENTAEDVYEKAYDHVDNTTAKTKSFKDTTLEKTKHTLSEIADSLEQISNKLRKQD